MSEGQPRDIPTPRDERDELAALEAQLRRKKIEVEGSENFGKYDITVANHGEDTYGSYLEKRPGEGVVRDGSGHRDAQTGQFAGAEQYNEQIADNRHNPQDRILDMMKDPGEAPDRDYESMGKMQLVKRAVDAMVLGDRAEVEDIRAAFEHNLMEEFTREHSDVRDDGDFSETERNAGADFSQEAYDAELADFDRLVARMADQKMESKEGAQAENQNEKPTTEEDSTESATEQGDGSESDSAEGAEEQKPKFEFKVGDSIQFTDDKGNTLEGVLLDEPLSLEGENNRVYYISTQDGNKLVREEKILFPVKDGMEGSDAPAKEGESKDEYEARNGGDNTGEVDGSIKVGDRVRFKNADNDYIEGELVKIKRLDNEEYDIYTVKIDGGEEFEVSYVEAVDGDVAAAGAVVSGDDDKLDKLDDLADIAGSETQESKKAKIWSRVKTLFGGPNAWAAAWTTNRAMQRDIKESMTDEEKEQRRKRNRVLMILGGIAGGAALVGIGVLVAKGIVEAQQGNEVAQGLNGADGGVPPIETPELATEPIPDMKIDGWAVDANGVQQNNAADIFHDVLDYSRDDVSPEWLGRLAEQAGVDWRPGNTLVFEGSLYDDNNENLRAMLEYAKANNIKP